MEPRSCFEDAATTTVGGSRLIGNRSEGRSWRRQVSGRKLEGWKSLDIFLSLDSWFLHPTNLRCVAALFEHARAYRQHGKAAPKAQHLCGRATSSKLLDAANAASVTANRLSHRQTPGAGTQATIASAGWQATSGGLGCVRLGVRERRRVRGWWALKSIQSVGGWPRRARREI
jgi:hypothetical protein